MTRATPEWHSSAEECAEAILSKVGKHLVLGLPLGLGKANAIVNALYERAEHDRRVSRLHS